MGYTTDFVGHLDISPPLNAAECAYLEAFRQTRHDDRGGSPYDVPGHPWAPQDDVSSVDRRNTTGPGKPQLWCQWVACVSGCCLTYDGEEKFYAPLEWVRYLVDHLLRPGAHAASADHPQLTGFTFDHRLDGLVVGCRRDTRELFAIVVEDNRVDRQILRPGDPEPWEEPDLPYQQVLDRDRARRRRRREDSPSTLAQRAAITPPRRRLSASSNAGRDSGDD